MDSIRQSVVMERLVNELGSLLKMLDHETVSPATSEKMASIRNILDSLQLSVNGSDVYMNSCLYGNGTSFVESLFEDFDCDLHMLSASPVEQKEHKEEEEETHLNKSTPTDTPPPLPTTPLPDDYYEEAVPLDPGSTPQYFTTNMNTSRNSVEDAYYEDADNNYPLTQINGPPKNSYNDSDALSSSYESYEEEDDEAKGRDQREESSDVPVRDCRICAFLLRKKRFGQWAKQLVVVRDNKLQCYKSIKESTPQTELPLSLCNVIYVPKEGRKKRHELRFSLPGGEALVLAVQSKEQAQRWLKVVQDVSSQSSNTDGLEGSTSPIIQRKLELDKILHCERQASDSDSGPTADNQFTAQGPGRDSTDSLNRGKRGAFSELTGSMSRAAGKKINRIITFSKKKPPLPGEPPSSSNHHDNPRCGYLSVCLSGSWKERWCVVRGGSLCLLKDPGDQRPPVVVVPLKGAEVATGSLGPKHPFSFCILQGGSELASLEASGSEDLGRWLGVLFAETGITTLPEELHYDYIDVDTITDIRHAARNSFLWATTTATSSSSASTDSRMYDEVYESVAEGEGDAESRTGQIRRHASFSSRDSEKTEQQAAVKRHASNVNQYARYGKTRAEEDARRYLNQKEELEKQKEELRNALISLRREKKEVKEEMKSITGHGVEQRLAKLELLCKQKEEERVELELRLTEVKENLKKSLARGALGPPTDTKISIKAQGNKVEKVYNETVPVNSASELRKRPPSLYASSKGTVMQKAKEWESKKGT
ncbi:actin filament-associated protein 1-like 1 [Labrus mixtus]|uniref:actin filament-associated protein 1-like 1 n=1 Tax=Labrus mixtus TaxID=508554 RepID=UPI0029C0C3F3|nr:actin filament-associated protein 1-like 1 [Labrus mixtus]